MSVVTGLMLYAIIWWTVLFAVLPWGIRPDLEENDRGHQRGAPVNPRIGRKALITTGVSAVIWLIIYVLIAAEIFSFRDWAGY